MSRVSVRLTGYVACMLALSAVSCGDTDSEASEGPPDATTESEPSSNPGPLFVLPDDREDVARVLTSATRARAS